MKPGKNMVFNRSAFSISHTTVKPFLFGDLQLTGMYSRWVCLSQLANCRRLDDDAFLGVSASIDIGTITLEIQRRKLLGYHSNYDPPPKEQKVHEQAKKATVHRVTYVCATVNHGVMYSKSFHTSD